MKFCNILKTGKFSDSKGNECEFTTEKLDKIVDNFKNVHKNVPICVGHPKTNAPAYGWLDSVKRVGNNLYCSFKDVQDEFKDAVNRGLFKNRSISLDKDLNIRHLAFLGGQAPAVKGLENFCFEDDENAIDIEFADFADKETLDFLFGKDEPKKIDENGKNTAKSDDVENIQKKLEEEMAKNAELTKQIETAKVEAKMKDFSDFAERAVQNGNILPRHKESVINLLLSADRFGTFNFADSGEMDAVKGVKTFVSELKALDVKSEFEDAEEITDLSDYSAADWAKAIEKTKTEAMNNGVEMDTITAINQIRKGKK